MSKTEERNQPQSVLVEKSIKAKLDERFIETDDIASVIALAVQGNKNVIFYGPAGFGKSEMIDHITASVFAPHHCNTCNEKFKQEGLSSAQIRKKDFCEEETCGKDRIFIQSFGEGMSEDRLYGGMDFAHFDEHREMQFKPQHSFLNYECAIFEEIFDAPPVVLLSLKDTLTARELRNGEQRYKMKTRCIIALTNKEPNEISALGPSAHALIERFPLQYNVKWDKFSAAQFRKLFNKVKPREHKEIKSKLADITALVHEKGGFISPRTAIHALETAIINADRGIEGCFENLKFVAGYEQVSKDIEEDLYQMRLRRECVDAIVANENDYNMVSAMIPTVDSTSVCAKIIAALKQTDGKLEELRITDDLYNKREELREKIRNSLSLAREKMIEIAEQETDASDLLPHHDIEQDIEDLDNEAEVGFSEETIQQMTEDGILQENIEDANTEEDLDVPY